MMYFFEYNLHRYILYLTLCRTSDWKSRLRNSSSIRERAPSKLHDSAVQVFPSLLSFNYDVRMTDFAPDGTAALRTSAYSEYFNTDGSKATPLFDGSFGRCFRSQAARQWSGVCISVTLWLVYRHLLRRPRRSSANTVARHTVAEHRPRLQKSPHSDKPLGSDTYRLIIKRNGPDDRQGRKEIRPKKKRGKPTAAPQNESRRPERGNFGMRRVEFDEHTDLCRIKLRSLTRDSRGWKLEGANTHLNPATVEASRLSQFYSIAPPQCHHRKFRACCTWREIDRIIIVADRGKFFAALTRWQERGT